MKVLLIGNKVTNDNLTNKINDGNFDYIVRYNGCQSLRNTYTDKTDLYIFGGWVPQFLYDVLGLKIVDLHYINTNSLVKYRIPDTQSISDVQKIPIVNLKENNDIKEYAIIFTKLHDLYDETKFDRLTTLTFIILYLLTKYTDIELYCCCFDVDRSFTSIHSTWHIYSDYETKIFQYLVDNNYIKILE